MLWLSGAPISIIKSLQGLEFSVPIHKPKEMKQSKGDFFWPISCIFGTKLVVFYYYYYRKVGTNLLFRQRGPGISCLGRPYREVNRMAWFSKQQGQWRGVYCFISCVPSNRQNPLLSYFCPSSKQVSPKHPDFKRKDGTGSALWLNSAPKWILPQLEGLEFDVSFPQMKKPDQAPNGEYNNKIGLI